MHIYTKGNTKCKDAFLIDSQTQLNEIPPSVCPSTQVLIKKGITGKYIIYFLLNSKTVVYTPLNFALLLSNNNG